MPDEGMSMDMHPFLHPQRYEPVCQLKMEGSFPGLDPAGFHDVLRRNAVEMFLQNRPCRRVPSTDLMAVQRGAEVKLSLQGFFEGSGRRRLDCRLPRALCSLRKNRLPDGQC